MEVASILKRSWPACVLMLIVEAACLWRAREDAPNVAQPTPPRSRAPTATSPAVSQPPLPTDKLTSQKPPAPTPKPSALPAPRPPPPPRLVESEPPPEAPTPITRNVRVVPEQQNGAIIGLRLFGIRPGSLLAAIGLKSGDRLESINGFNVATPEEALEAYARLRTAERLNVRLNRGGRPVELTLNIH
jgi:general secretion pathway protein C